MIYHIAYNYLINKVLIIFFWFSINLTISLLLFFTLTISSNSSIDLHISINQAILLPFIMVLQRN
jgi:hypothetical protein